LIRGTPTTATVTASRAATVLFLAREYVDRLVAGVPEIKQYLDDLAEERELDTQLVMSDEDFAEDDERVLI
jgi:CRP-like cAMP-binding protein